MTIHCYVSRTKRKSLKVLSAFCMGSPARLVRRPDHLMGGISAFYGMDKSTYELYRKVRDKNLSFIYIDNPYLGRGVFYRVTKNALQHDGKGNSDSKRLKRHNIKIKPWKKTGRHILITTQSELWYSLVFNDTRENWLDRTTKELKKYTDRPIVIRYKPSPREIKKDPLDIYEAMKNAWAVVTHSSNTAVQAILEGIPAFSTYECAALTIGSNDLSLIESPRYPDGRFEWASCLADNQWTLNEMRHGVCWEQLNGG